MHPIYGDLKLIEYVERMRSECGLPPLPFDCKLTDMATEHAYEMSRYRYDSDYDLKGRNLFMRYNMIGGVGFPLECRVVKYSFVGDRMRPLTREEGISLRDAKAALKDSNLKDYLSNRLVKEFGMNAFAASGDDVPDYGVRPKSLAISVILAVTRPARLVGLPATARIGDVLEFEVVGDGEFKLRMSHSKLPQAISLIDLRNTTDISYRRWDTIPLMENKVELTPCNAGIYQFALSELIDGKWTDVAVRTLTVKGGSE